MFIAKFAIFLYLEGRDLNGKQVRENVLDSADGFRLYKLLHEYLEKLTDDELQNFHECVKRNRHGWFGSCIFSARGI